jgi:hypothetical protein
MIVELVAVFVVPVLFCAVEELKARWQSKKEASTAVAPA